MIATKVAAMKRIRDATDTSGGSRVPRFMYDTMEQWERDGLVEVLSDREGRVARITDKGRAMAKKAMV